LFLAYHAPPFYRRVNHKAITVPERYLRGPLIFRAVMLVYSLSMALIENKKVRLNFELLEEYEAGMELFGHEVKALRNKLGSLEGAHIVVRGNEAYLVGATIPPYQPSNTPKEYDAERPRRLLLNRKEIAELAGFESKKGLTIVPISVYSKGRNLKLSLAVARGKKQHDKRQTLKEKETKRDIERTLKSNRE